MSHNIDPTKSVQTEPIDVDDDLGELDGPACQIGDETCESCQ